MKQPQGALNFPIIRNWLVRRPYVYRYLEQKYVDDFFESGKLRLSSFNQFKKHADEQRLDGKEGWGIVENTNEKNTMFVVMGQGSDAYVLCGSMVYSKDLSDAFGTDSGFRIDDPTAFANAISGHIPGFRVGIEGPCIYRSKRVVSRGLESIDLESLQVDPEKSKDVDMTKMFNAASAAAGDDLFFLKLDSYIHQAEYRLLWMGRSDPSDFIDIVCKEATQFCTPFSGIREK